MINQNPNLKLKLGKRPATRDKRDLKFSTYFDKSKLPELPDSYTNEDTFTDWGMLGNDQYGCCVFAGAQHETMLFNKLVNTAYSTNTKATLLDYTAVTGFDPKKPWTDQGTNVRDALNYRRKLGLHDAKGGRHKIYSYVTVDSIEEVKYATYLFKAVGLGIEVPAYIMQEFEKGETWDIQTTNNQIEGGHYIPVVGYGADTLTAVTWAKKQAMTNEFFSKYCDEAYLIFSLEDMKNGKSLEGFDTEQLNADLPVIQNIN